MKWEVRRLYFYVVSLVTLVMLLFGTWAMVMGLLEVLMPGPPPDPCLEAMKMGVKEITTLTAERCQELQVLEVERRRIMQIRGLIANVVFLGLVGPAYLHHWRQAKRSEPTPG